MEIQKHLMEQKKLYSLLYDFFASIDEEANEQNFQNLINFHKTMQNYAHGHKLASFLYILNQFTENHHRITSFFNKIVKILLFYKNEIKQSLSNVDLFKIFINNKAVLLLLLNNDMIKINETVMNSIKMPKKYWFFFGLDRPNNDSNFDEKCRIGENDSYVCILIRNDLITEFVQYLNQSNLSINATIEKSLFETHPFLIDKEPTLIEYAAFYGSFKIFQYLRLNGAQLNSSLWIYAIHSNNSKLIDLLEQMKVQLPNNSYDECIEEAIKCHHNEIADYFIQNFVDENVAKDYYHNILHYSFHYENYEFLSEEYKNDFTFAYACKYNYIKLVELLLKKGGIDINKKIIKISIFLN